MNKSITKQTTQLKSLPFEHEVHGQREFQLQRGLTPEQIKQLKTYSLDTTDTDLQKNSSDRKRFGEGSYNAWLSKNRTAYALIDNEDGTLAAFAWFGPKPYGVASMSHLSEEEQVSIDSSDPGNYHTGAYRSYAKYRGTGIMKTFLAEVLCDYRMNNPSAILWFIIQSENTGSIALARKLGFTQEETIDGQIIMVLK